MPTTDSVLGFPSLADFTSPVLIAPQLAERDTAGVIQELSRLLQADNRIPDLLPFYHAVLNREFLVSTAMGGGMAFPHARLNVLKELCFAFGRTAQPISWGPNGAVSVHFVFLIAVPATAAASYMNLVSGLARLAKETPLVAQVQAANDSREILAVLSKIAVRRGKEAAV